MKNKTNYGKIIAITLSIITCASAIAFVIYRLFRNLIEFCNTYEIPEVEEFDELGLYASHIVVQCLLIEKVAFL